MSLSNLPATFVWSRMGIESGEALDAIITRKDWERQLGGGLFYWGVGHSLGTTAVKATMPDGSLKVVFSRMRSTAKSHDVNPDNVAVWTATKSVEGEVTPLRAHVLVTSRATLPSGKPKLNHYALVCASDDSLNKSPGARLSLADVSNFKTGRPVGGSQVTAVVAYREPPQVPADGYPVHFIANLVSPYQVKLANPRVLSRNELESIERISRSGSLDEWRVLVKELRF
jgi:hypothetical protein